MQRRDSSRKEKRKDGGSAALLHVYYSLSGVPQVPGVQAQRFSLFTTRDCCAIFFYAFIYLFFFVTRARLIHLNTWLRPKARRHHWPCEENKIAPVMEAKHVTEDVTRRMQRCAVPLPPLMSGPSLPLCPAPPPPYVRPLPPLVSSPVVWVFVNCALVSGFCCARAGSGLLAASGRFLPARKDFYFFIFQRLISTASLERF